MIEIAMYDLEKTIVIVFKDQGQGLTEQDKARLFTKYGKLSAVPTNKERQTV